MNRWSSLTGIVFLIFSMPGFAGVSDFQKPYRSDSSTRLLLHFDQDKFRDASDFHHRAQPGGKAAMKAGGKFGSALFLGGDWDAVVVDNDGSLSPADQITFEAWVKPSAVDGIREILSKPIMKVPWNQYHLEIQDGKVVAGVTIPTRHLSVTSDGVIPVDQWTHLAGAYDGKTLRLYVNGVQQTQVARGEGPIVEAGKELTLGRWGGSNYWYKGYIDEVRVSAVDRFSTEASSGPDPSALVIKKTSHPPILDGKVDLAGGEWTGAVRKSKFLTNTDHRPTHQPQPEVYLNFDDRNLYIGFIAPFKSKLKARITDHDGPVWEDDAVEIFLDPYRTRSRYYQFAVNANGAQFESSGRERNWNGRWEYKTTLKENRWMGEIAIPFAAFDLPTPFDGETWGINVCRDYSDPKEYTSLSGATSFHDATALPDLVFTGGSTQVKLRPSCFRFDYRVTGTKDKQLAVTIDVSGIPPGQRENVRVDITLEKSGEKPALTGSHAGFSGSKGNVPMPLAGIPPGTYNLRLSLYEKNVLVATQRIEFIKPDDRVWSGNAIGVDEKVPAPWTPLVVEGRTLSCWNRKYEFNGQPFPTAIQVGPIAILAGPIRLAGTAGKNELRFDEGKLRFDRVKDDRVVFTVQNKERSLTLDSRVTTEFDGMMRIDLKLLPRGSEPVTLNDLHLEIPLKADYATLKYLLKYPTGDFFDPNIMGTVEQSWQGRFCHQVWLGNENIGLAWFTESDRGWHLNQKDKALQISRTAQTVVLRINLVDHALQLTGPWSWTLGLQATPVKPLPANWQKFRLSCWQECEPNFLIDWAFPWKDKWFAFPAVRDVIRCDKKDLTYEEYISLYKGNAKFIPYINVNCSSAGLPEYRYHETEWTAGGSPGDNGDVTSFGFSLLRVCTKTGWTDFFLHSLKTFVDRYPVDGVYIDNACVNTCYNTEHGCGYHDGKEEKGTVDIFGSRALQKRLYKMIKETDGNRFVIAHNAGAVTLPVGAFYDAWVDGERFMGVTDYMEKVPLDKFQSEFIGSKWGIPSILLAEIKKKECIADPKYTETMIALARIHGTNIWSGPTVCNIEVIKKVFRAEDKFGMDGARFLPYWNNGDIVHASSEKVKVTLYAKPGKVLLYATNLAPLPMTARIKIDVARLGLSADKTAATDLYLQEKASFRDETLDVTIKGKNFRMILLGN